MKTPSPLKNKIWQKVSVHCQTAVLEQTAAHIFALGAAGITEKENGLEIYFADELWNAAKYRQLKKLFKQFLGNEWPESIEIIEVPEQNWNESWKDTFKTFHLSRHIVIRPEWERYEAKADEHVIIINPKMAFGTGHHETTQLVLSLMWKYLRRGMRLLDAGTGSGILAIFAAKLGSSKIVAFDHDPVAIENTRENFELNQITIPSLIFTGVIEDLATENFDMIVANIDRNELLKLADVFHKYIEANGLLILSGILSEDEKQISERYQHHGWIVLEKKKKKEWIAMVLGHE